MATNDRGLTRRNFLTQASYFGAFYALAKVTQFPAMAGELSDDPRISSTPIADAGFASVHKIGEGVYATISDPSKGLTTMCNGGFIFGKDAALLIEGFVTANGAAFQLDALHKVTQVPPIGALDSHYHFDHSCGNSFYGGHNIQLWAHAAVPKRITENYQPLQNAERAALLAPFEKRVADAKSEASKQHAQSDLTAFSSIVDIVKKTTLTLPNRSLHPATLPLNVDLGNYPIVIESFPGHSGTDLIVRVPEQKVVFTGDLIFNGSYPACFDEHATIAGWRTTLKTFASFDKDTLFVPGHGQICGQDGVARLSSVFNDISEQAESFHKAGVPIAEAVDRYVVPEKFKSFGIWAWGYCIGDAITKLYAEWGTR
jgi:glyoxylase-like metal-dependent hydrolase (beta-lactamase superfamily II)